MALDAVVTEQVYCKGSSDNAQDHDPHRAHIAGVGFSTRASSMAFVLAPRLSHSVEGDLAPTGGHHAIFRYYDPATAQFLTRDPAVAQTREAYGYAGNNPTNFTDPTGLEFWDPKDWSADDIWDETGGKVVSATQDLCFESWQEAATCTAVVAGTVSLGVGGAAVLGLGGGLAGTAGTVSTYATGVGFLSQAALTADDCSRGVDGSCLVNGVSTAFGGLSFGLGFGASYLARAGSALAIPAGTYAINAGIFSFGFGFPGYGGYLDRREC